MGVFFVNLQHQAGLVVYRVSLFAESCIKKLSRTGSNFKRYASMNLTAGWMQFSC